MDKASCCVTGSMQDLWPKYHFFESGCQWTIVWTCVLIDSSRWKPKLPMAWMPDRRPKFGVLTTMSCHCIAKILLNAKLNPGVGNHLVITYAHLSPEPGRQDCVISLEKGVKPVNTTSTERRLVRKQKFSALYVPPPGFKPFTSLSQMWCTLKYPWICHWMISNISVISNFEEVVGQCNCQYSLPLNRVYAFW